MDNLALSAITSKPKSNKLVWWVEKYDPTS